jgi:hypothetical protein
MNSKLLWFLLCHEFRLRQRETTTNLLNQVKDCLLTYLFVGVSIALFSMFVPYRGTQYHLFSNPLPDIFLAIAGGIIDCCLFVNFLGRPQNHQKNLSNNSLQGILYAAPISSQMFLTRYVLDYVVNSALTANIYLLPIWLALAIFYGAPQFILGFPLVSIFVIGFQESLSLWIAYIFSRWSKSKIFKILSNTIIISCIVLIISMIPVLLSRDIVFFKKFLPILDWLKTIKYPLKKGFANGGWFGIDSWLWLPGRATLLDPLPTLCLLLLCASFIWLTIQKLHRPLLSALQTPIAESKKQKVQVKSVEFQSNLIYLLILREWRHLRISPLIRFFQILTILLFPGLALLSSPMKPIDLLPLALCTGLWPAFVGFTLASNTFEGEDSLILIESAPVSLRWIGWCKRFAVLIPLWAVFLPVVVFAGVIGRSWGWVAFFVFAAPLCHVILRSWNTLPVPSIFAWEGLPYKGEKSIKSGRDQLLLWGELFSFGIWAVCPVLMFIGQTAWGLFALSLEVCLMALAYRRNLQTGDFWGI